MLKKEISFKNRIVSAILVLVMSLTSFIGTTFAWFTDSVTSGSNIIKPGNLDANMYYSDELLDASDSNWKNADGVPVFTHQNWEPGYTEVKYVKIENAGDLAFKWMLSIEAGGEVGILADVIDVYYVNPVNKQLENLEGLTSSGNLSDVIAKHTSTSGVILPEGKTEQGLDSGAVVLAIAMHMQESAGNKYQDKSVCDEGFLLKLVATQYNFEKDSYDESFDKDATWDQITAVGTVTVPVTTNAAGELSEDVSGTINGGSVAYNFPAGMKLEPGTTELTLSVRNLANESNLSIENGEERQSLDVHVEGVAEDNTVPAVVTLAPALPKGLNLGNYRLYHFEDGAANQMTLAALADVDAHNEFAYDPVTGNVTVAMATYSEVALVADTENAWVGNYATAFAGGEGTAENPYIIANADQLAYLGEVISNQIDGYSTAHYKLVSNINLGGEDNANNGIIFYPIGYHKVGGNIATIGMDDAPEFICFDDSYEGADYANGRGAFAVADDGTTPWYTYGGAFKGTFDGNGNTISNIYQNTWQMKGDYDGHYWNDAMGVFGYVYGGTVKNLTVNNFSSDGEFTPTGVIAAYAAGNSIFENIAITNCNPRVYNTGNGGIIGVAGDTSSSNKPDNKITLKNITVDQSNKISALWGSWDVACGGLMGMFRGYSKVEMINCHVAAQIDVNNDVCANYQYYWYRYSGMFIGSVRRNTKDTNGYTVAYTDNITADGCTYTYGEWNEYWYCELVKNSLASYTHDHQFSRLTKINSLSEIQDDNGNWNKEGNFVIPAADKSSATCYHIFKNSNGELYQHFHNVADESNPDIYETKDINGDGQLNDLKEDRTCYYMPFGQMMNGDGYGVKPTYEFKNLTEVKDGSVLSGEKFDKSENCPEYYRPGQTIKIGDLFKSIVDDSKLSKTSIYVAVSPATANDNVSATYNLDLSDWKNSTLTFADNCEGSAKVVITDYFYCTATVIYLDPEKASEKFEAKEVGEKDAYTQISLGNLFENTKTLTGSIAATITNPNGKKIEIIGTVSDWATKTIDLTNDGTWTVVIKDGDEYCEVTTMEFTVNTVDKFTKKFDKDFLYRVGNKNTVSIGSIFGETETAVKLSSVNVTIENVAGNAAGTFTSNATWTSGTIQFTGTGVVKVIISAVGANPVEINLEVVNATNTTSASFSGDTVLLNDVNIGSNGASISNVLYGNGFTIDATGGPISHKYGAVIQLYDGAVLKNVSIVGKEFTTVAMNVNDTNYGVSVVRAWGTVTIENSYISGCRSAVSVTGTELTIKDSVIANGVYANIDFRSGILNLHNVTTINEPHDVNGTTVVGLGIVGNMTASAGRQINITGTLTQYNWVSQNDCKNIKASGLDTIFNSVFTDSKYASLRYTYKGTTYVNTGILSLCSDFTEAAVSGKPSNYGGMSVGATISQISGEGYVWAPATAGTLTDNDMKYHGTSYTWKTTDQGTSFIPPAFDFANAGITTENGVVQIEYESGSSYTIAAETIKKLFNATKYGQNLSYTVTINGIDYTGKDIVFNATTSQTYTIKFTVTDNFIYDKSGNLTSKTYEVTKELKVFATVVDKGADAPTFTFYYGTNGSASAGSPHTTQPTNSYASTIKQVGDAYYIMPNVNATSANAIGSKTVDGTTIYYPIVDGINVRSGSSTDYDFTRYYPIFKAVKISDNGTEYSYTGTKEIPATVTWVSAEIDSGNGASSLNDGFGLYNNQYLCKIQKKAGDAEAGGTSVVQFSYTALDGNTYKYYVGYRFYDESEGCVTPDTLVTLADGSQVRVDSLTGSEELLVWNMETGKLDKAPIMFVDSDPTAEYEIIHLYFSDGTDVKVIYEHGFWDYDLNRYVYLDKDAADYIGHTFAKQNGDKLDKVQLVDVVIETEVTEAWSPVTAGHLCYFVNGMLSMPGGVGGLFNIFEVDPETMTYDYEQIEKDIATYGLYTYEELNALCPLSEKMFVEAGGAYLKISIGKGNLTEEELFDMINRYSKFFE